MEQLFFMEVLVMGAGYVGLVQGAGLASSGNHVTLVDVSKERVQLLRDGGCPIYEPGLPELLHDGLKHGRLHFHHVEESAFKTAVEKSEVIFLAVGTPEGSDGLPQMGYLFSAASMLVNSGASLDQKVIVVKSTVPVGTGDELEKKFLEQGARPIVVSNPEFLKQGAAVQDFMKPERVIVGTSSDQAAKVLHFIYRPFMMKRDRYLVMSRRSAELVKYACNAFLATKISFINEMSRLSEQVGADIRQIREGMITDSRIGDQFLFPGVGYGGSCFPKDTHALIAQGKRFDTPLKIIQAADDVNEYQKLWSVRRLQKIFGDTLKNKTIAIWGLAFKANTDDLREAPSVYAIHRLVEMGVKIRAHDPIAMTRAKSELSAHLQSGALSLFEDPYDATKGADALLVLTEWQAFRTPTFRRIKELMRGEHLLDGRLIYDPEMVQSAHLQYHGVGL